MKKVFLSVAVALSVISASAQIKDPNDEYDAATYVVPFLTMATDARGGGMGDMGAATSADAYSQYWNPSKYAFAESKAAFAINYTPWLRKLTPDIDLVNISGYYNFNQRMALSASFTYFSMGEVWIRKTAEDKGYTVHPNEFSFDLAYSIKVSRTFSLGVALRYIRSDMTVPGQENVPGNAFGADLSGYLNYPLNIGSNEGSFNFGFNFSNIGTKISYDEGNTSSYIPANMRLGMGVTIPFDAYNRMSLNVDCNRLMVPIMPRTVNYIRDPKNPTDVELEAYRKAVEKYDNSSSLAGIFNSFAPDNYSLAREFDKIKWSVGAEYSYNKQFFVRTGYFYEAPSQGNRQYVTFGAGFKMYMFGLDVSYYLATAANSPLDQTLRFSLVFDFDGLQALIDKTGRR